ncbi:MAG: N-acetylmuramoyl-L-alanine amidase-like domain-containing protein [Longimicrobiales bacterium]
MTGRRFLACAVAAFALAACSADVGGGAGEAAAQASQSDTADVRSGTLQSPRPAAGTSEDWRIAREKIQWVRESGADGDMDFGEVLGAIGEQFLGTKYEPHTLELPGTESLVINLEVLDCVTFVENVLTLARLVRRVDPEVLEDSVRFQAAFKDELTRIRYRGSTVDGYASRLHYFSEWMEVNDEKGIVDHISEEIGGTLDPTPIDFMSTHADAYAQLEDPNILAQIVQIEARIGRTDRFFIPADEIEAQAHLIRTGDVIAATSTVDGLDVAHTGIAVWRDGELRLLHAPLVGSEVQLSERSLAERIKGISGQDGIMVARPVDPAGQ